MTHPTQEDDVKAIRDALAAQKAAHRAALMGEAMAWTGDFRVPVWRALADAAARSGISLTYDDFYQESIRTRAAIASEATK